LVLCVAEVSGAAGLTPRLEQATVGGVLVNAAVAIAVRDVDLASWRDADIGRVVERSRGVPGPGDDGHAAAAGERASRLADLALVARIGGLVAMTERQAVATGLVELEHHLGFAIDEVQRVVGGDAQAMRVFEDAVAPGVEEFARAVEDDVGMGFAGEDVDVVPGVDGDGADLAP